MPAETETAALPQGSLELLDTPVARNLLASPIPARAAYTAKDGTPRIVPTWFRWTNGELVMPTYIQAPHIPAPGARRLGAARARCDVAISIDTGTEPPQVLLIRGKAHVTEVDGVDPDYAALGPGLPRGGRRPRAPRDGRPARAPAWPGSRSVPTGSELLDFAGGRLPGVFAVAEA